MKLREILAEKTDACTRKVKKAYKVWPSAYASGALQQCRKKGAKNWDINEDLRQWFKEKWVRFGPDGEIRGECARGEGEGKPKCLPASKARSMTKKERAKSARRKRRLDPNPDRKGSAIHVKT